MEDTTSSIKHDLLKEQQEQKRIGYGAKNKVTNKHGCTLPCDYLSKNDRQKLNGEVKSMNMHSKISWDEFGKLPDDLQKQYVEGLQAEFGVTAKHIAEMLFRISKGHFSEKTSKLHIKWARCEAGDEESIDAFRLFCQTGSWPVGSGRDKLDICKPITWSKLRRYPQEEQKQYLEGLFETYGCTPMEVQDMLGLKASSIYKILGDLKIDLGPTRRKHGSNPEMWKAFLNSGDTPVSHEKPVDETNTVLETPDTTAVNEPATTVCAPISDGDDEIVVEDTAPQKHDLRTLSFSYEVTDLDDWKKLYDFIKQLPLPNGNIVSIQVTERAHNNRVPMYPVRRIDYSRFSREE